LNFLLDNNLPPPLARALNELSKREGHTVVHLSDKFPPSTPDIEWVKALKDEGDWVVVSQDQFKKSDLEKQAFRQAGLTVFCLAKHWSKARYWDKAHQIVRWWPDIIEQSERLMGGAALRVPWQYRGRFEQIKG
jgi:PIN like domain